MPDQMRVTGWHAVEQGAQRIGDAARQQQAKADWSQGVPKWPKCQHAHPAHDHVENRRPFALFLKPDAFIDDAGNRHSPDNAKQRSPLIY